MKNKSFFIVSVFMFASGMMNTSALGKEISTGLYALNTSLLSNLLAKELCSCLFVTGAYDRYGKDSALNRCLASSNLPLSEKELRYVVRAVQVEPSAVSVKPTLLAKLVTLGKDKTGIARFNREHPEYGCSLDFSSP